MKIQKVTRRRFLRQTSAALSAAYTLPVIISASARGGRGPGMPTERIRMGFIGLGGQGSGHLLGGAWTYVPGGYVARDDVQVLAVCDVRRERRARAQQRCHQMYAQKFGKADYRGVEAYHDFREVLARPDIDAVLLALPYHWAAPMAIMAMRAGKDVYCEKPIAITIRQGEVLKQTAEQYSCIYQAGTQQRSEYGGNFRIACDWVRNGRIGELREVYAYRKPGAFYPQQWTSDHSVPVPAGFDWDLWLGPLPWRPYGGHAGHTLPGLFIGDVNWSPHHYDIIQWTVNPDPLAPIEVEYDKNDHVHYHYANGVVVHSTPFPGEPVGGEGGACFVGTEGRIAVDRSNLVSYPERLLKTPLRPGDSRVAYATSHSGNFLDCIRTRRQTVCNPEVAVYTMNAILVGGLALALQHSLTWHPKKGRFVGDDEANRLLSYSARTPWRL